MPTPSVAFFFGGLSLPLVADTKDAAERFPSHSLGTHNELKRGFGGPRGPGRGGGGVRERGARGEGREGRAWERGGRGARGRGEGERGGGGEGGVGREERPRWPEEQRPRRPIGTKSITSSRGRLPMWVVLNKVRFHPL